MEKEINTKTELFETMPVRKAILTLAIPTIISQMVNVIYNIADTYFIGRTGNPYMLAGVSVCLPIFLINITLGNLFGLGGGSLISRMMGEGANEQAKSVSSFCFYGSLVGALIFSLVVYLFMEPLLRLLGASDNTLLYCKQYTFYVVVIGTIPTTVSIVSGHLLRNVGYSTQASIGMSGGGLLNLLFDPLFMFVLFPEGQEVKAAAIATLLSTAIGAVYLTIMLGRVSKDTVLSLSAKSLKSLTKPEAAEVMKVGVPSALLSAFLDVANVILNASMSVHGDLQLAAIGIVMKIERIPNGINLGLAQGMLPLVAYNYSNQNRERMRSVIKEARKMGLVVSCLAIVLIELFAPNLVEIFLEISEENTAAVMTLVFAAAFLRLRILAVPFQFLNFHSSYCMQAAGDGKDTLIHAFVRVFVLYIPCMLLFDRLFGEYGLAAALPVSELLSSMFALVLIRKLTKNIQGE